MRSWSGERNPGYSTSMIPGHAERIEMIAAMSAWTRLP